MVFSRTKTTPDNYRQAAITSPVPASGPGRESVHLLSCSLESFFGPRTVAGAFVTLTPARTLPTRPGHTRAPGFLSLTDLARHFWR